MKNLVLIVDDAELNRELLKDILRDEYYVAEAKSGREAVEALQKFHKEISVVLLDLVMPQMDGFGVLEFMHKKEFLGKIPVLVISGETSVSAEKRCFEYGVSDFIKKPFDTTLVKKRVDNITRLFQYQNRLEATVEKQTATLRRQYKLLQQQAEKLRLRNESITDILGTVVEYRNLESGQHIMRVRGFTRILAKELMKSYPEYGLTEQKIETIAGASALHDIGKIAIPDNILLKPAKLTPQEYEYMKSHTVRGAEILKNINDVWDEEYKQAAYEICRHHHERYDGRGYPDGLAGEEIPISAQLVSVADVYDALVSPRVYKGAYAKEEAFQMILTGQCGIFSPKLLKCLRSVKKEFEAFADENGEKRDDGSI